MDNWGEYYLHTNGSLIYKPGGIDDPDSTFIVKIWNVNLIGKSPQTFLDFLMEAKKLGAKNKEIIRLFKHNQLDKFIPNVKEILSI